MRFTNEFGRICIDARDMMPHSLGDSSSPTIVLRGESWIFEFVTRVTREKMRKTGVFKNPDRLFAHARFGFGEAVYKARFVPRFWPRARLGSEDAADAHVIVNRVRRRIIVDCSVTRMYTCRSATAVEV
jgi:hypothetical protein